MKSYVWLTFAFMGWGYYEMSGGNDFEPVKRDVASIEEPTAEAPEIVARADTPTLLSVSSSNVLGTNIAASRVEQVVDVAVPQVTVDAPVVEVVAPAPEPVLDIREVAGSRVNLRMGPGTGFDVITTLDGGSKLEILEVNEAGWANVSTVDRGLEGWMAERLLTPPET